MLTIRLQRTGKKNQADFRIVLAEKKSPVNKKFTEVLGSYNPRSKKFQVKEERVKYWIGQHVELSPTVHNLFVTKTLLDQKKVKAFNTPKKPVEPVVAEAPKAAEASVETPAEAVAAEVIVEEKLGEKTSSSAEATADKPEEATAEVKEVKAEEAKPEKSEESAKSE